ncbi:MAG TPA: 4-alpha-glucanotransferase [Acholeplasmataceae bacterium]|nr:4-alpha-glucanotransferase [Acholeplasmataceae bacterium]
MKKAGILLHISSLPGPFGIGKLGKEAYEFIHFLKEAGQTYWQILPIGPTAFGNSPYQSPSIYAGNPLFIDPRIVQSEGLINDIDYLYDNNKDVDYSKVIAINNKFLNEIKIIITKELNDFVNQNDWLVDYALYNIIKKINNNKPWYLWERALKNRDEKTLKDVKNKYKNEIKKEIFVQYLFYKQWFRFKNYANKLGIKIIGDIPIYVAYDSVEVWKNPQIFILDEEKIPIKVAGVPPDYFSKTGQLWGNPLYDWTYLKINNYQWWIQRIEHAKRLYDIIRIDHFRAFSEYYAIPYGSENAISGKWEEGPGMHFFKLIDRDNIIAEDLGVYDDKLKNLLKFTRFPGMKVLQFEMPYKSVRKIIKKTPKNTVLYTGTHDNDTIIGWFTNLMPKVKQKIMKDLKINDDKNINWDIINLAYQTKANTVIIPFQDFIGAGSYARMNTPGIIDNNWTYRISEDDVNNLLASKIYNITNEHNRL